MILAALTLIALLTLALVASMAFIARDLAIEQQARQQQRDTRVPIAA